MFLVNMEEGRIVADDEIKNQVATEHPYRRVDQPAHGRTRER